MSDSQPNYREAHLHFQHPSLTKISGDPTYKSLANLEKEIEANGKSVPSTLGGGSQGHLGLVSSSYSAYGPVSPRVPFIRPDLPILPDLSSSTANQIAVAQEHYTKTMEAFKMCNLTKRTIIQKINTAVDLDCLRPYRQQHRPPRRPSPQHNETTV